MGHVAVERLPRDAEFLAQFADFAGVILKGRPPFLPRARAVLGESGGGACGDECSFELGQGGKDSEYEKQPRNNVPTDGYCSGVGSKEETFHPWLVSVSVRVTRSLPPSCR